MTVAAADIPIRQVILYKSGVGYFERAGTLRPGESGRLDFKASDMNDVLKSLTIDDRNGGKVTGLHYDSSEPLEQKLADFPFKIAGQASLAIFLDQMKGAKVEMKYGADTISGAIVSGRVVKADDKQPEREQLVVLLDSGDLRTFDLAAASAIRFVDPKLKQQLRDYLTVVNQSRSHRQAQYLYRFLRRQGAPDRGQLHDSDAGVEVQLPADFRRQGWLDVGRLGHHRQHYWRRLDQRAAGRCFRASGVIHQQALRTEIRAAADRGAAGRSRGRAGGLLRRARSARWRRREHRRRASPARLPPVALGGCPRPCVKPSRALVAISKQARDQAA